MLTKSKVRGMLIGGAVGDAWGMPVETWTPEKILEVHPGGLKGYAEPIGHKWFTTDPNDPDPKKTYMRAGYTTDDTQLTGATIRGIIEARGWDMDKIAAWHVVAMKANTAGWGHTTVEAIRRLANGVSWKESGKTTDASRGTGNGVPMKCAPVALLGSVIHENGGILGDMEFYQKVTDYSAMTHYTQMSAIAAMIHCEVVRQCLVTDPENYNVDEDFLHIACNHIFEAIEGGRVKLDHLNKTPDNIEHRLLKLWDNRSEIRGWDVAKLRAEFGNGSCYVYDSLPFTYAFYYKNPHSLQTIYDLIHAGGDTDTNAKMALEMIGALHGEEFFMLPENKWTIERLFCMHECLELADQFCDIFGVP